jgi:hypothetical protein
LNDATTRRLYASLCAAIIAFAAVYGCSLLLPVHLLWYYPLEHRWSVDVAPAGLAMGWYGRTLLASAAAGASYAVAWSIARRFDTPRDWIRFWTPGVALALLAAAAAAVWHAAPLNH